MLAPDHSDAVHLESIVRPYPSSVCGAEPPRADVVGLAYFEPKGDRTGTRCAAILRTADAHKPPGYATWVRVTRRNQNDIVRRMHRARGFCL